MNRDEPRVIRSDLIQLRRYSKQRWRWLTRPAAVVPLRARMVITETGVEFRRPDEPLRTRVLGSIAGLFRVWSSALSRNFRVEYSEIEYIWRWRPGLRLYPTLHTSEDEGWMFALCEDRFPWVRLLPLSEVRAHEDALERAWAAATGREPEQATATEAP